ncbi:MAG: hypothetical protein ACR2PH_12620 [Desulfobulbia bacterium]
MKAIFTVVGLMIGMLGGAYVGANYGADYVSGMAFSSPDEVSSQAQYMLLGGLAIGSVAGTVVGWLIGSLLFRSKPKNTASQT